MALIRDTRVNITLDYEDIEDIVNKCEQILGDDSYGLLARLAAGTNKIAISHRN